MTLLILVQMRDYYGFQISILLSMSFTQMIAVSLYKPFEDPLENRYVILNESLVCLYIYLLIGLCSDCDDFVRVRLGWALLATVFFSVVVNMGKLFYLAGREVAMKIRIKRA